ncbi:formylglycine-generating enzyme family protein [Trichothermofontia sichuanensis B231]|uniref:formylglycine-generating enzyme family protein n=1 Tax=Trichothermofontia sichuanensis TaxID=3045816 RepID=UPI002246F4DA|nr:formylglycine-generating enzyme family protein [Trichothermofontia sichuanensis]UZQ54046.1 formylglycine-generating enzyme family protein [Trichothermofontia sichuanensis B231]
MHQIQQERITAFNEALRQQQEAAERRRQLIFTLPNDGGDLEFVEIRKGTLNLNGREIHLAAFRMSKYPITQRQYQAIMGNNPSDFKGDLDCPVERVSWNDAKAFCKKLSQEPVMAGQKVYLPSEAQWEYACRAGTTTKFWFGNSDNDLGKHAWYDGNSGRRTHSVYEKAKEHENFWGLVDMHGHVWEWCADNWTNNTNELPNDGTRLTKGGNSSLHPIRSGLCNESTGNCRASYRGYFSSVDYYFYLGFQVVLVV